MCRSDQGTLGELPAASSSTVAVVMCPMSPRSRYRSGTLPPSYGHRASMRRRDAARSCPALRFTTLAQCVGRRLDVDRVAERR
jgi:hypothetical protein